MKCHQCDKPGFYQYSDDMMLCVQCHSQVQTIETKEKELQLKNALLCAAMLNNANQELDAIAPWGPRYQPIPVAAIAAVGSQGIKMTNIHISDSQIGVINTGDLAKIDAAVTLTRGSDAEPAADALKQLTEAVLASEEITTEAKRELGELLAALSKQLAGDRSQPVAMQLVKAIEERTSGINSVWSLAERIGPLVSALFQ